LLQFNFLLIVIGRLVTALIAIASLRAMTTFLAPSDYGQWSLLMAYQAFGALLLINPVDQHVFRYAHAWWDNGTLIKYLVKYNLYIASVSLFIGLIVMLWWNVNQNISSSVIMAGILAGLSIALVLYLGSCSIGLNYLLNMLGFRVESVIWAVISALVGLVSSMLLVMQYPQAIAWLFGQALGLAVGALGALISLRKHSTKQDISSPKIVFSDFLNRTTVLNFCLPLAAATGFMWLQNTGYRLLVQEVWGVAALGIMVVGLSISAQLTAVVESLAMQLLYPYLARHVANANSDNHISLAVSDLMNVLAPIYAVWAGFNAICATALLELLTDARYHAAIPFVIFGAMIEFMRCTTNLWSNTARAIRQTKGLIIPYMLGAAIVCFGVFSANYFKIGLLGLSYILVIGGALTLLTMIFIMQRLLLISIDLPRLLIGFIVMSICFAIAIISPINVVGVYQSIALLVLSGVVVSFLIGAIIWRNPALTRLLSASLRTI
jgi:O-antigen/teichoic acid export membrane protein